ncbi:hypothetical protein HELRODRAFT_71957, partial [Helobdella robusta]|uniref:Glycosyltransferase-like protein LARGE2 n=1 Tax=Helobdella robusta TaxID=6412 RepID=T1G0T5_HELRO
VTLVTQLSIDRIQMLEMLASYWPGPISLALYLSDAEAQEFLRFQQGSVILSERYNIGYHVVFKDGHHYPVNHLRNVALNSTLTTYAFLTDIDFLPMPGLYDVIVRHLVSTTSGFGGADSHALVIPAFETERYKQEYPTDKQQLLQLLIDKQLFTFRYHVWPQGQAATDYERWKTSEALYKVVSWEPNFEPFIVIDRSAPRYDERFVGFGWNKVSHIMEVDAQNYEFWVVPDAFILHLPHSPSLDIAKYRSSESYRYCLRLLKDEFLKDLSLRYGIKALKYLSPDG